MNRLFESEYEFGLDDHLFSIDDIAVTDGNREHDHDDVETGLAAYTVNWECIAESTERRRGSDKLYLVDDQHYVWCSRTGMESAGNSVWISEQAPDELQFSVVSHVFEAVASRKFGDIKDGIDKTDLLDGNRMTVCSPRAFILAAELSDDELDAYFDELADIATELVDQYAGVETVDDIKSVVEWFREERKWLFREYTGFEPTVASQAINSGEIEYTNGWNGPDEVDAGKSIILVIHEEFEDRQYMIEANTPFEETFEVRMLVEERAGGDESCVMRREYDTWRDLVDVLHELMEETPDSLDERYDQLRTPAE